MTVVWILVALLGIATAQCPGKYTNPEVAGIAVGVFFATLALCAIILGIVLLIRFKRKKPTDKNAGSQDGRAQSYDNPTFQTDDTGGATGQSAAEQRDSSAEKGYGGYVRTADYSNKPKVTSVISTSSSQGLSGSTPNNNNNNDSLKRSLMKLKPSPVSPQYSIGGRAGSQGSLDASCQNIDPEVISVSLQSEDIIGLGFNITGSMRDGIYVSQVHNRGPASESGCIKPGDRIKAITISFENMVYEDALTILSYASPYPVRLQLQKNVPSSSRVDASVISGDDEDVLHHPVYRSQSMDDVSKIARDSVFNVRRARSEMKRGSSKKNDQTVQEGTLRKWNANDDMGVGITGPSLAVNIPDFDINTSSLRMDDQLTTAAIHGQGGLKARELKFSDGEVNARGNLPKVKGDVRFKKPNVDLCGDDQKFEADDLQIINQIRGEIPMEDLRFGVDDENCSHGSSDGFDFNGHGDIKFKGSGSVERVDLPKGNLNLQGTAPDVRFGRSRGDGQVEISYDPPDADIDVSGKKSGFKMPGFKLPGFKKPKASGDVDMKANVDIPDVEIKGGNAGINLGKDIELPDVDLDDPNISGSVNVPSGDVKTKGSGFKLPDFNMPSFKKSKAPDADIDLTVKGRADLNRPDLSGDIDFDGGDVDIKAKGPGFKMPDINLPSFKKSKAPSADVDLDVEGGVDFNRPDISGSLDVEGPDVKSKGSGFKLPDFNMPSFKKPKADADVDFDVKGGVDMDRPNLSGSLDVEGPDVKGKGSGFKLPDFNMPSFKKPKADADVDFDVEGGVDIDKPNLSGSVDVEGPDAKGKGSGFKLPDFNLPSFKKGKALDGDIDFDVKGGVDLDRPDLSGDIDLRGGDVDVKAKGPGFKMPDINLPSFKKPKAPDANVDLDVKGGVDLNKPKISGDVDLEGDGDKSKGWGIKLPDFELPSFKSPKADADVDLDTGKVNLGRGFNADYGFDGKDIDVNTGKVKLQNDIDLPEVDVGVKGPNISGDADVEGADFKTSSGFKMPDFKLPGFKRSKGKLPDADLDADADLDLDGSLKGGSINVKAPDVKLESGNIDMDLDVEGGKLKKDSGFKMPGFKLPSMKKGDADFDADVDVNAELPHIDVNKPELSGDVNLKGGEVKASKDHGFSMPDFKLPSFKKPEGKANIKGGGELGADLPDVDTKANIDVNVKGKGAKAKGSGFKFPGFKKPKVEAPDVNADVNLDSGKVNFDKRVRADVDLPDVNVNVGGKGGIGYDVPKVSGNAGLGTGNLNLNAPKVDIDLPQVDVETKGSIDIDKNVSGDYGVEGHGKGSKGLGFKLPEFKRPDFKKPNVNVDVKAPKTELEGGIKADFDLPDVEGPNVKRSGHGLPNTKVKAPGLHGPSAEVGKVNVNVPSADIDARVDAPRIDIPDTNVDVNVRPQGSPKGSGFKLPEFKLPSLHKPDANAPDVIAPNVDAHGNVAVKGKRINATVDVPNVNVNVSGQKPGVDIKAPEVKADKKHSGFKLPHFKMPGRKKASIKGPDVSGPDVTVPEVDIPNVEVTGPRLPEAGLGMPGVVMSGHTGSYRMEGPNTNLPNAEIDVKGPSIKTDRLKTKEAGGRFDADVQLPSVSLPSVSLSKDTPANKSSNIKAPSAALSGDFSTEFDASEVSFAAPKVSYPETDVSASISQPDVNVSKDHGIQLPHGDISVEAPDVNVALPNVGFSAEADIPGIDADKKRKKDDKSKKKEEEKGEKKKSGIQGWWQRRRRRRSSSSSSASSSSDSSDSEDEKKNKESFGLPSASVSVPSVSVPSVSLPNASVTAGADVPSASVSVPSVSVPSVSVPSVSAPSASAPSVSSVSVPSVSVPSVEASLPDISASALPSFSTETYSKSVDISMTEPKLVSPTLSGSVESASVSVPDISSVAAPSLKGDENLELPKMSMEADNSSDDSDDEAQAQTLKFDMPPSVAQEIEVHTEPVDSSDDSEDDHEEISNWRGEMSMPTVNVAYPDEPDVTNASMRVNLDQDSILVRDEAVRDETTSEEEEDDQERVSAMLREYLADDPMLMERLGFGTEYSNPEASVEVSGDTSEFLSRNGEALSGARQEIRRRSQSSTPERRRKWVDSSSSSRSSSPRPSQSEDMTMNLPSVEMSTERESESPALKMSSGGIAYDITPSQLEHLSLEEREEARARGEPRGGMAYYFDINDQLRFRNDDDDEESEPHPPLVHPRNFETENVRAQLRTNHLTDSDQEDDDAENSSQANFSTSLSKPLSFNTNYRGMRDSDENLTFKTVETTSTTTVTRGVREHDSEGNKTYTVTITTSQMDDSEA